MSLEAAQFMKRALTSFKHRILLRGEPSVESFCNSLRDRIHGTGQGTGWLTILWSVVKNVIISLMEKHQPGQLFCSPNGDTEAKQMVDGYVDDCNLAVNKDVVQQFNEENSKMRI